MKREVINSNDMNIISDYKKTDDILCDMKDIIEASQQRAYQAVNLALVRRNWLIRYRIAEEEMNGENRADYGACIINKLSKELSSLYGKGFTKTNLYSFYSFYKAFPQIFHTVCGKSQPVLSWSHYRILLQVKDVAAREWYAKEAAEQTRNISSQYYYRLLKS